MLTGRFAVAISMAFSLLSAGCSTTLDSTTDAGQEVDSPAAPSGLRNSAEPNPELSQTPDVGRSAAPGLISGSGSAGPSTATSRGARAQQPSSRALASARSSAAASRPSGSTGAAWQGVTATTIKIGVVLVDFRGLQNVNGFKTGDPRVQAQAVADHLNSLGGVAGRKIVLTFATIDAASTNFERDEQAMCTQFTEDDKVFAVMYALNSMGKTFLACLADHRTPLISSGGGVADQAYMDRYGKYYFTPGSPNMTRMATAYVDSMARQGFLGDGAKVGYIRVNDAPFERAARQSLVPRLAKYGVRATEAVVSSQESLSNTASQMPAIVLRFQQSGINRVMFLDNGQIAPLFAAQAASQSYYPRYGITSVSLPDAMRLNVPERALLDAVGMGWMPALDVMSARDPLRNASIATCSQIMEKSGQGAVDRTGTWSQRAYCDDFFFFRRALLKASQVNPDALAAGVAAMARTYESPMTFATSFAVDRHDGSAAFRDLKFEPECKCFAYTGPNRPLS